MKNRMRKLRVSLMLAFLVWVLVAHPASAQAQTVTAQIWTEMGAGSATGGGISNDLVGGVGCCAIAVNQANGNVYVVWEASNGGILVRSWNGAQWGPVGGPANGGPTGDTTLAAAPVIAVRESDGHVFVAWRIRGGSDDIYVREFDGTNWLALGAGNGNVSNTPSSDSLEPSILLMPNNANQPVVVWKERFRDLELGRVGATAIYARRWTGLSWVEMGAGSVGLYPDPAFENPADPDLQVICPFVPDPPPCTKPRCINACAAGINADDGVAFVDIISNNVVDDYHVFSNGPRLIGETLGNAAVVFRNGQWRDKNVEYRNGIHIRRFNGNSSLAAHQAWEDVGRVTGGDAGADSTLLATDLAVAGQANGLALHVAADLGRSGFNKLQVLLWTGNGWAVQGLLPLATGTGDYTPFFPSIALDASGRPIVAWNELVNFFNAEVYVRGRGTDAGGAIIWQEMGTGSASGGGISSNAGLSGLPALTIHRTGGNNTAIVAWTDGSDPVTQDGQTYVRRALLPAANTFTLSVSKAGTGTGTVTSDPAGINCGADCSEAYASGTAVGLTATAAAGSVFAGWGGPCTGVGACTVTMDATKVVTATFNQAGTLGLALATNATAFRTGDSLVISAGVDNPGLATTVDFYFGALLPDGDTVVFFTDLAFNSGVGSLASPATLRPIVSGVNLTAPFTFNQPTFFTYRWGGTEPPGGYTLFLAAVTPGALADNSIDPGDLVALATAAVSFAP